MDNAFDVSAVPDVVIGGRKWPVPMLTAKQNRIIDPLILGLLPVFAEWQNDRAGALAKIGTRHYDALLDIAFAAISRSQPDLTREAFLELPVTLPELIAAFSIIAQQTGIFEKAAPGDMPVGEEQGV